MAFPSSLSSRSISPPKSDSKLLDTSLETKIFDSKNDVPAGCSMFFVKEKDTTCFDGYVFTVSRYKLSGFQFPQDRRVVCDFMMIQHHLPDKYKSTLENGYLFSGVPPFESRYPKRIVMQFKDTKMLVFSA